MRYVALAGSIFGLIVCCAFGPTAPLAAQTPPGPSDATALDRFRATAAPPTAGADLGSDAAPSDPRALRRWLLARLIVDRNLNGEQAQSLEQKLANISDEQLDVVARVYREKRERQAAAEQAELELARENLEQLKHYRDAAADELTSWRAYRQAQYLNFGYRPGGYAYPGSPNFYGGYGMGGYGFGGGFGGYPFGYGMGVYPNVGGAYMGMPYYSGYGGPMMYGGAYPMFGGAGIGYGAGIY